ncbi:hypothetical protein [Crossiella sp. SN42]|nr:hypothetical protein [Crossiella sp. SN42]
MSKKLAGYQPNGAGCTWTVHIEDVDRWVRGEPARFGRRAA